MSGPSGSTDETIDRRSRNRDPYWKRAERVTNHPTSRPTRVRFVGTGPFHGTAYANRRMPFLRHRGLDKRRLPRIGHHTDRLTSGLVLKEGDEGVDPREVQPLDEVA